MYENRNVLHKRLILRIKFSNLTFETSNEDNNHKLQTQNRIIDGMETRQLKIYLYIDKR